MENNRQLGWTTIEEAKLLVEAGLDPNTADMLFENHYGETIVTVKPWTTKGRSIGAHIFPCWSLGALIDMMPMFEYNRIKIPFGAHVVSTGEIVLQYFTADTGESIVAKKGKEFIDAVISMILWLLKNNLIEKQE